MSQSRPRGVFVTFFGVIGTLVFGFLALEYVLARYAGLPDYLALPAPWGLGGFLPQIPNWASLALTFTIWTGLLGALLLMLRDRAAALMFSLTLVFSVVVLIWSGWAFVDGHTQIDTVQPLPFGGSLFLVCFGLWLYARTAKRSGTL